MGEAESRRLLHLCHDSAEVRAAPRSCDSLAPNEACGVISGGGGVFHLNFDLSLSLPRSLSFSSFKVCLSAFTQNKCCCDSWSW